MTVIQIRGTSGSGKTFVMREVMKYFLYRTAVYTEGRRNPLYYALDESVAALGSYESTCGGCDNIGSARAVFELIQRVEKERPQTKVILAEGLLLSEDSKWTKQLEAPRIVFLTTELERCLRQVENRRNAAGNEKPLNPANTTNRVGVIERARVKLLEYGITCRRVPSEQAPKLILQWIKELLDA